MRMPLKKRVIEKKTFGSHARARRCKCCMLRKSRLQGRKKPHPKTKHRIYVFSVGGKIKTKGGGLVRLSKGLTLASPCFMVPTSSHAAPKSAGKTMKFVAPSEEYWRQKCTSEERQRIGWATGITRNSKRAKFPASRMFRGHREGTWQISRTL